MKLKQNDTLLFIGDSITDCNRNRPVGKSDGLGDGYVNLVNSFLWSVYPDLKIDVLNTGISGNKVIDLKSRWNEDAVDLKPDWLSVMIGINDVWRQFDNPLEEKPVTISIFEETYIELIESIIDRIKGVVLMTPFYLENNKNEPMRKMMDEYGIIVKKLSQKYKTLFVDVQEGFDNYMKHNSDDTISGDKVHPNLTGHMIIARYFLNSIGFKWK